MVTYSFHLFSNNKKWGSLTSFLSYEHLKPKKRVFSTGFRVAMVTNYEKIIHKTYLAIIHLSNDTMLLSFSGTEWFNNSIKRKGL